MSDLEAAVFVVLWILVLGLALLVLILYRQLDRLIVREQSVSASLLPAGSLLPDLLVVGKDELEPLAPPPHDDVWVLAFITTTCPACQTFLREITTFGQRLPTLIVVRGQELENEPREPWIQCRWVANPGDLPTYFGVTVVPTIYLVSGRTVVAGTVDGSSTGLQRLVEAASGREQQRVEQAGDATEPVASYQ